MEITRIIISGFIGGIFHLDNVQFGQFFLSRPSFMGILIGCLNGCPVEGAVMGILIELIYSDFLPLGGSVSPNGSVAASCAVLLYAHSFQNVSLAFFVAVFAGALYSKVEFFLRKKRSAWNAEMEMEINENRFKINYWIMKALMMEGAAAAGFIIAVSLVFNVAGKICNYATVFPVTDLAFSLVPWIVLTALILKFRRQVMGCKLRKSQETVKNK
ncbi:MAG: PTS sugar transporter subunit IIC [Elusimicrobiales bacterium]|nr:PTS sugar transporter subunit IIC [Elusimicrobiales bacterium]MCK5583920.1 PTS sugar transporter subunit IIC [Elusimicrobiales bacterium]